MKGWNQLKTVESISKSTANKQREKNVCQKHIAVVGNGGSVFKKMLDFEMNKVETPGGAERN